MDRALTTLLLVSAGLVCALAGPVHADFEQCKQALGEFALAEGIDAATIEHVFPTIEEIPRVVQHDRAQPEFTQTFTEYYGKRVTDFRIQEGRRLLTEHGELLNRVQRDSGVPPQYVLALWGLETNFGRYLGKLHIPSALATLACEGRRPDFFRTELLAVLSIVQRGDVDLDALRGSWAGAIGHVQFMPTTFLHHAVDADGDGRRDLIGNVADALASAGRYLAALGWQSGYRWGREVLLPADFDYSAADSDRWQTLRVWRESRMTDAFGSLLPPLDLQAALLVPTGHTGPAFLVYPNFRIIMGWNRSEAYAVTVGRLADRIAGAGRLRRALPPVERVRVPVADVVRLQERLAELGYEAGAPGRHHWSCHTARGRPVPAGAWSDRRRLSGCPDTDADFAVAVTLGEMSGHRA